MMALVVHGIGYSSLDVDKTRSLQYDAIDAYKEPNAVISRRSVSAVLESFVCHCVNDQPPCCFSTAIDYWTASESSHVPVPRSVQCDEFPKLPVAFVCGNNLRLRVRRTVL